MMKFLTLYIGQNARLLFLLLLGALLGGCATTSSSMHTGGQLLPGTVVDSLPICPSESRKPYAQLITTSTDLSAFYQRIATQGGEIMNLPQIDFSRASVVLVGYGQKPTSGYQINFLNSNTIKLHKNHIDITVTVRDPSAEDSVATVITSPCVLVETQQFSPKTAINVFDQNNNFFAKSM